MDKLDILEQMFDNNYVVLNVELIKDKLYAKIKTLSVEDCEAINVHMMALKSSEIQLKQAWVIENLSRALISYKDKVFKGYEDAKEFLTKSNLSINIVDKLAKVQSKFEAEVKSALSAEDIEEAFFDKGGSQEKPEQSPAE